MPTGRHTLTRLSVRAFGLVAMLALPGPAGGQGTPVKLTAVTPMDGLSSGVVTALLRDAEGFLWVGTPDGLNRYDGHQFQVSEFDRSVPGSLPGNHVRSLLEDRSGRLWIGTAGGGLAWLDRSTGRFESIPAAAYSPDGVSRDWVETIRQDEGGELWIGTLGGGLTRYDPASGQAQAYMPDAESPDALSHSMVNVVFLDSAHRLWVGTDRGLNLWTRGTNRFIHWLHEPGNVRSLSNDRVLSVAEDSTGGIWIGTEEGLNRFAPADSSFERIAPAGDPSGLSHPHVTAVAAGSPSSIWVGTYGGGLDELSVETGQVIARHRSGDWTSGLVDDRVRRIVVEEDGTLWLGTWGGGVTRVLPIPVRFALERNDPEDRSTIGPGEITSVAVEADGTLWAASFFNGLNRQRPGAAGFVRFRHDPNVPHTLSGDDTNRLLVSSSGHLWVGTWQNGLNRLDPRTGLVDRYPSEPTRSGALSGNRVTALEEGPAGTLWVGTSNGLNRLEEDRPPGDFSLVPDLHDVYVEALLYDASGALWVGTAGAGLFRLDPGSSTLAHFAPDPTQSQALSHDHVTSIHQDPDGEIWVGTLGGGLCRLMEDPQPDEQARFIHYGEAEGLIDNSVTALLSDAVGRLWISTLNGLSILDRRTGEFIGFDAGNGLPVAEFAAGAATRRGDDVYLGTADGMLIAPGGAELPASRPAPIVVTSARALEAGEALIGRAGPPARLSLGEVVAFEFALLDFNPEADGEYAYRLDGLDGDWVPIGSTREIAFTSLAPGDYAFRVRGRERHGPWAEVSEPIRFAIVTPFWMTPLFRALTVLLLVGMLASAYRLRVESIRRRQAAVTDKENQFTALMEHSHDLVALLDAEHNVIFQGPSVEQILGFNAEERVGTSPVELAHPDDREALRTWLDGLGSRPNRPRSITVRLQTRAGRWLDIEALGTAFFTPAGERRTILNAHDVSERIQAEQRSRDLEQVLSQRQRLDAIGTLAGGVAHDFNNLLTVIGGHATLLEMDGADEGSIKESASAIRRAQQSGASLTRQLLAFARKQVVAPSVFDLNSLVADLERLLRRVVRANVALEVDLQAERPWVEADRGQMEQVLMNLVINANDALPDGGTVSIRTSNVRVQEEEAGGRLQVGSWTVLHVEDGGCGMGPEVLPHIFEPFFTTKERGKGTGLGLSTVYGIVIQSGGQVRVASQEGQGASFHIYLPQAVPRPRVSPEAVSRNPELAPNEGTILVAEDDPEIRSLVTRVLRRQGYTVVQAEDGTRALEVLTGMAVPPDLLLTDLVMPRMGGGELSQRVSEICPGISIVFMSGYADGSTAGIGVGPNDRVLLKPFTPAALLERIREEFTDAGLAIRDVADRV